MGNQEDLENDLRETQRKAFSEGTVQNLLCQWRAFYSFCNIYRILVWPATAHIMCLFAQFLSYNLKSPNSIVNYLSGVRTLHLLTNVTPPTNSEFETRITIRGLRRRMKHCPKQAVPLTPLIMGQIHEMLNFKKKTDIVFWATILLGFFTMFRASNLVPKTIKKFSALKNLTRKNIQFNKVGMLVNVSWSKTIQFHDKQMEIPVFAIPNSILCPIKAIKRVLKISRATANGPLLGISNKCPYTYYMLQKRLKEFGKKVGIKRGRLSTHSMRRGSVLWAQSNKISESLIQIYGGWSSNCFKRYLQFPLEMRIQAGRQMVKRLKNFKSW